MRNSNRAFSFKFETQQNFSKLIQNLNSNKAAQQYDIPIKIFAHMYYTTTSRVLYQVKFS